MLIWYITMMTEEDWWFNLNCLTWPSEPLVFLQSFWKSFSVISPHPYTKQMSTVAKWSVFCHLNTISSFQSKYSFFLFCCLYNLLADISPSPKPTLLCNVCVWLSQRQDVPVKVETIKPTITFEMEKWVDTFHSLIIHWYYPMVVCGISRLSIRVPRYTT